MITRLFVYGTLRPGQPRWPYLEPLVDNEGHDDTVTGALYDTGNDYPAARFDHAGTIYGRTYSLHLGRLHEALTLLDEIEGAVANPFERIAVTTRSGSDAWAYQIVDQRDLARIRSGDWLSR